MKKNSFDIWSIGCKRHTDCSPTTYRQSKKKKNKLISPMFAQCENFLSKNVFRISYRNSIFFLDQAKRLSNTEEIDYWFVCMQSYPRINSRENRLPKKEKFLPKSLTFDFSFSFALLAVEIFLLVVGNFLLFFFKWFVIYWFIGIFWCKIYLIKSCSSMESLFSFKSNQIELMMLFVNKIYDNENIYFK